MDVYYMDNTVKGTAAISIAAPDFSGALVWAGPYTLDETGMVTIVDEETAQTVTFSVTAVSDTSCTINIEGYGEVELKPVTVAEFKAYAEKFAAAAEAEGKRLLNQIEESAKALEKEISDEVQKLTNEVQQLVDELTSWMIARSSSGAARSPMARPSATWTIRTAARPS